MKMKWKVAEKLFTGQINPMVAVMTGKIKAEGNATAFMILQELL